ncbi:MAG: ribonuclease R [Bacteroidales bacterium]|jgi:ribonuclease R|nr:ribonuclease R [Bacteroidales bacterium]
MSKSRKTKKTFTFRRKKKTEKKISQQKLEDLVISLFNNQPDSAYSIMQIANALEINTPQQRTQLNSFLEILLEDEYILEMTKGVFRLRYKVSIFDGVFDKKSNGKNFVTPDDGSEPVLIAERNSLHAMRDDRVKVRMFARRKGYQLEGEIIEIIEHKKDTFVGTLEVSSNFAFLLTDKRWSNDIFIPKDKLKKGKTGDKAVVKITSWPKPEKSRNPIGEVIDILGASGNNNTEMHAILAEYGLPYHYPESVEKAARRISEEITAEEISKRTDFREIPTFTIDPKDAKDFDDALSVRKLKNGNWEVGVHIADVSHYVSSKTVIDKEAGKRATSVYLVDRTIPMLPERLSNELCSLRPKEEKLTFSTIFEMNDKAEVKRSCIARTIIRSDVRFDYEEAQEIIETGSGQLHQELSVLNKLAKLLREKRFSAGAIDFDRYEVKFEIDEKGKPLNVYFKEAKDANKLVEEFMLLANKTVAEFIGKPKEGSKTKVKPFIYRIHDLPDPAKMENLSEFISRFGYKIKTQGKNRDISTSINRLLDNVRGKREQNLIESIAVRSMAKAAYSTQNIGHYGLSFDYYTHFTSPIRRYPDLMVHRLLERYMAGGKSVPLQKLEDECKHCSNMEQLAANAERSSIKYKQVEFMSDKQGQVFDGVISGVTEWGIYVELNANKCEGMIPIRDLDDDFYEFDEKTYSLIGRRKKRRYRLGDEITVRVGHANLERKQLDFVLIHE